MNILNISAGGKLFEGPLPPQKQTNIQTIKRRKNSDIRLLLKKNSYIRNSQKNYVHRTTRPLGSTAITIRIIE
jgi:hypothetical protein